MQRVPGEADRVVDRGEHASRQVPEQNPDRDSRLLHPGVEQDPRPQPTLSGMANGNANSPQGMVGPIIVQ